MILAMGLMGMVGWGLFITVSIIAFNYIGDMATIFGGGKTTNWILVLSIITISWILFFLFKLGIIRLWFQI